AASARIGSFDVFRRPDESIEEEEDHDEGDVGGALRLPREDREGEGRGRERHRGSGSAGLERGDREESERKPQTGVEMRPGPERRHPPAEGEDDSGQDRRARRGAETTDQGRRERAGENDAQEKRQRPRGGRREEEIEGVRRVEEAGLRVADEGDAEKEERI